MPRWFRLAVLSALACFTLTGLLSVPDAGARLKLVTKPVRWLNKAESRTLCGNCADDTLYACIDDSLAGVVGDTSAIVDISDMIPPPWRNNLTGGAGIQVVQGDTVQTMAIVTLVSDSARNSLSSITLVVDAIDQVATRSTFFSPTGVQIQSIASTGLGAQETARDFVSFPIYQARDNELATATDPTLGAGPLFHNNLRFRITATVGLPWCRVRGFITYYADVP